MTEEDATELIDIFTQYKPAFIKLMLLDELGTMPPDEAANPMKSGAITFLSFLIFGSIPLWVYVIIGTGEKSSNVLFALACVATAISIFALGALKGKVAQARWWKAGFTFLLNGAIANVLAYFIGWGLQIGFGVKSDKLK